ncbi:cilia- and flagella-associated protein 58 isoform X2 [Cephus cinctus]|nr:cilia- and flagella-associated protein 58 isoform X2 [Cephus cinctus]
MKLADAAHAREQNAQEMIENLRLSISKLNHEIDEKNRQLGMDEDNAVNKQKEGLLRERERLMGEMETLRQRMNNIAVYTEELERKNSATDQRMADIQESMNTQLNELSKEHRARERAENEVQQLQEELKIKTTDLQTVTGAQKMANNQIQKLENQLKDQKSTNEKMQNEIDDLKLRRMTLQNEINNMNVQMESISKALEEKNKELRMLTQLNNRLKSEMGKYKNEKDWLTKKLVKQESMQFKIEQELSKSVASLKHAESEITMLNKQTETDKKTIESLMREKDIITKNMANLKETVKKFQIELAVYEQNKRKLESETDELTQASNVVKRNMEAVEKERDKFSLEAQELAQQVEDGMDELRLKQVEIFDLKKRLVEAETKYRQQQNLFEAVRADRNSCSKSLIEAQDEIQELKSNFKITNHQIEQLKEDVATKEASLIKEEFLLGKAEKEKESLKVDLEHSHKESSDLRHAIEELKKEEKTFRHTIHLAEMDISRLKKDVDTIMNERDILGTQLVRRNDELSLQYSRIKILDGTVQRGEAQYAQRLDDIRLLKLEVKKLRTEKTLLSKSISNISDLRQEIFHLERDLTKERLKVMALEEEMQNPLNIHRWRKLEGSDPDTYELLVKIQILQKRILRMSSEMIDKEKKIKESEKLYMNLREILSKLPGPEVLCILDNTQKALRERGKEMKCLVSELNMCETRSEEYKFNLERMNKELCNMKVKYYNLKRKEQKSKEMKLKNSNQTVLPTLNMNIQKYRGGGFNMSAPTPRNFYSLDSATK